MDREIYIAGVGMTPFGRHLDKAVWQLASDAVRLALADAGAEMSQIEQAYYGTGTQAALQGQFAVPGQVAFDNAAAHVTLSAPSPHRREPAAYRHASARSLRARP